MVNNRKIKVLVVDDSLLFRETIAQGIAQDFGIEVVGTASDPFIARDKILELKPDVISLDVEMPKMNGIEFLKKLMPQYPLPVVVVSSISSNVFDALNAGAVDFVTKPDINKPGGLSFFIKELIVKIKIASTARMGSYKKEHVPVKPISHTKALKDEIIAIGASTGGTEAIYEVIKLFPPDMPGIVIVQHMPPVFTRMYAERLNNSCMLEVKEAQDGDLVKTGRVLVAPGDFQMKVVKERGNYYVKCYKGEKVNGHCPSVDVLFDSIATAAGSQAVGVILTGMGCDGAKGLLEMKRHGAYTIGQDEKSCVVYGMPRVAFNIGAVQNQAPLDRIPQIICKYIEKRET
ncbi:MAG TPA: chemotaxis response regulator protein-glutamate methylesterase [Clostridiales bacterium]|nr:chemotaxis response regulator protein-glutamate methylesterase [Clostridiales bacterium]